MKKLTSLTLQTILTFVLCVVLVILTVLHAPDFRQWDLESDPYRERERWMLRSRPRPLVVAVAGVPRTGSIWVYNVLRILLRHRDPNSVAGYAWVMKAEADKVSQNLSSLDVYQSLNTTVLVKIRSIGDWHKFSGGRPIDQTVDITVLTHRDLRSEVRSIAFMSHISQLKAPLRESPYIFENANRWMLAARRMLDTRQGIIDSAGDLDYLDVRYELWHGQSEEQQLRTVRALADKLDWKFTEADLRMTLTEATRLSPPPSTALLVHPVSQLQGNLMLMSVKDPRIEQAIRAGYKAIEEDPRCLAFLKRMGYLL